MFKVCLCTTSAPPTPTEVTAQVTNASSLRLTWRWTSSDQAPDCFNTTYVTYRPEGGDESFQQLSDPAATEATLTDLQCNINYTISVHTSNGSNDTRSAPRTVLLPARGTARGVNYCFWHYINLHVPYPLAVLSPPLFLKFCLLITIHVYIVPPQPHLLPLRSQFRSQISQVSG